MSTSVVMAGDIIVMRDNLVSNRPGSAELQELVAAADISVGNLECLPIDYRGYPVMESGGAHFGCSPDLLDELLRFGFNGFGTSNNHTLNYGVAGVEALIDELHARSIPAAGAGMNAYHARRPAYIGHENGTVALLSASFTYGRGHQASAGNHALAGRPGLNPAVVKKEIELSPAHFTAMREIAELTGMETIRQQEIQLGFRFPPENENTAQFLGMDFVPAAHTRDSTVCDATDLADMQAWVREAKRRSNAVIVSIHSHEQGGSDEEPAPYVVEYCRAMIDAGASAVMGHGPHFLRPLEMYRGRPIFYSLGNFVGQNELVELLPGDSYREFRVPPTETPSQVFDTRTKNDTKGFPAQERFWRAVVPRASFDADGGLSSLEIFPITLDRDLGPAQRGKPRLDSGRGGTGTLRHLLDMSRAWNTAGEIREGVLHIETDSEGVER